MLGYIHHIPPTDLTISLFKKKKKIDSIIGPLGKILRGGFLETRATKNADNITL